MSLAPGGREAEFTGTRSTDYIVSYKLIFSRFFLWCMRVRVFVFAGLFFFSERLTGWLPPLLYTVVNERTGDAEPALLSVAAFFWAFLLAFSVVDVEQAHRAVAPMCVCADLVGLLAGSRCGARTKACSFYFSFYRFIFFLAQVIYVHS